MFLAIYKILFFLINFPPSQVAWWKKYATDGVSRTEVIEAVSRYQAALDPYTFVREAYRQRREFLIYDGNPPSESIDDYLNSPDEPKAADESSVLKVY